MDFEPPPDEDRGVDVDGTVIVPKTAGSYPSELFSKIVTRRDDRGGTVEYEEPLFESGDGYYTLDIESLARLVWEHRQYSAAQEFSPSHLDILRVVQRLSEDADRVLTRDVKEQLKDEYAESTISTALGALAERGLLSKDGDGVYRYAGFEAWCSPDEDEG